MPQSAKTSSNNSSGFSLREGFHLPLEVRAYLAEASVDALAGQGAAYRTACRNLSELTRLIGAVLCRARARAREVPNLAPQIQTRRKR